MKVQSKISLTSFILIFGLLVSSGLFFSRIYNAYLLKNYTEDTIELEISMNRFINTNLSLYTETGYLPSIISVWFDDLQHYKIKQDLVLNSRSLKYLSRNYKRYIEITESTWKKLEKEAVSPLENLLQEFQSAGEFENSMNEDSFYLFMNREQFRKNAEKIEKLKLLNQYQRTLNTKLIIMGFSVETLLSKAEKEVDKYVRESIIITVAAVLAIILTVMLFSLRTSNSLIRRIVETNNQVKDIAGGKLNFEDSRIETEKDEFDELLKHYQDFSHILSDRLDSLKYLLQDIGNTLGDETDIQHLQETIVELGMDSVGADSGMLFLADSESDSLKLVQRIGLCPPPFHLEKNLVLNRESVENYYEEHPITRESPIFGALMIQDTNSVFLNNSETERRLPHNSDQYHWLFISSLMALPLIVSKRLLGMLVLYKTKSDEIFTDLDFTFFQAFTNYAAQSIDNMYKYRSLLENREIQKEVDIAAGIQRRLLPETFPPFSGGSAEIYSLPARGISGDYFDAIKLDDKRILYTICDVAGKGIPASMLMIMIRTILHAISHRHKTAHTLLRELNYHIAGRIGIDQYATMAVFILDTENKEISYSNAAHHPLYIFRHKENSFRSFDTEGLPIGVDKQSQFGHKRIKLYPGDYIFLFTDGLPEARDSKGEEFSIERLLVLLSRQTRKEPEELIESVTNYLRSYTDQTKQHDDQTFLALKIS